MAGHVCIPDELAKDEIGTCAIVSPWRSRRACRLEGRRAAPAARRRGRYRSHPAAPSIASAHWNAKRITYNGASGYILSDGTMVAGDGSGGFRQPNGAHVAPDWAEVRSSASLDYLVAFKR
jgi:hypothetical protein